MKRLVSSSFLSRVKASWQRCGMNDRIELTGGVMGACRHEKVRPKIAALALVGLLVGQTIMPGAMLISNVQAEELRQRDFKRAEQKRIDDNTPAWAKMLEKRTQQEKRARELRLQETAQAGKASGGGRALLAQAQRGGTGFGRPPLRPVPGSVPGAVAESQSLDCLDCDTDVRALDLTRVPTEKELRRAGQLGGALTPTRSAKPDELGLKLDKLMKKAGVEGGLRAQLPKKDPRERGLQRAQAKYERARAINLDFGKAIQEWNKHNYRQAAKMFEKHLKDYPESPWAGEAEIHLGCDAKYNGRFAEAQTIYDQLLNKTSSKPNSKLKQKKKERRARGGAPSEADINADVERAARADSLEAAVMALDAPTEDDDESFELHQKAKQRWADLDIATGRWNEAAEKLADIIETDTDWRRITWAQHWLRNLSVYERNVLQLRACGPKALGYVLASLGKKEIADKVKQLPAPSERGTDLNELKGLATRYGTPMEGFKGTPQTLEKLRLPLILHYDFGDDAKTKLVTDRADKKRVVTSENPFQISHRRGHFVVVSKVDKTKKQVTIFDPQEGRTFYLTYAQLAHEWSGSGLMLAAPKAKAVIRLTKNEMKDTVGGCCGLPSSPDDNGDSPNLTPCDHCGDVSSDSSFKPPFSPIMKRGDGSDSNRGEPAVSFNRITMNMFVHDTPLWYDTPKGPSVGISMSYNSQDATTQHSALGNKWTLNYGSYLVEDTAAGGGRITVFMSDGAQHNYTPNGSGGYNTEVDVHNRLVKLSATRYELHLQGGGKRVYDIPAGTNSLQPFLVAQYDQWGYGLTFGYDSQVRLTTITDANGKVTTLQYDAGNHLVRAFDPFGRHASFSYDGNGNLVEVIDMEGHVFQYTYDNLVRIIQLKTAQGPWNFKHEGPDGNSQASDTYPAPNGPMWASIRVTVTAPNNGKEEYFYYAGWGYPTDGVSDERSWHVDQNHYIEYQNGGVNNASSQVAKTQWDTAPGRSQQGATIAGKGKLRVLSNAVGDKNYLEYDPNTGQPNRITDERGQTSTLTYNAQGAVTSVTDPKGRVTTTTYAANGLDVTGATNALGVQVMSAAYNAQHQPTSITDESGTSTFSYTAWGAPLMSVDPQGKATRNNYNAAGQLVSVQRANAATGATWQTLGTFTYDEVNRVQTVTDTTATPNLTVGYRYNNLDAITQVLYPDGTKETTDYVCCGLPGVVTDRAGRKSYYDYDVMRRLSRVQDAQGNTLQMDTDAVGNLVRLVDSKGQLTRWRYDAMNRAVEKRYHDGTTEAYAYSQGLLNQSKGARGQIVQYAYDQNDNLTGINYPNMPDVTMSYNALDDVTQIIDGVGTHSFTYDNIGKLLSLDGPFAGDEQTFAYDSLQRLSGQSVQRGASGGTQSQSYAYDALGRLATLTSNGTQGVGAFNYNYVGLTGMLSSLDLPNGTQTVQSYDALQRLTQVVNKKTGGAELNKFAYAYDNRDVRTAVQQKYGADPLRQVNYTYDAVDQLVGEAATGGVAGSNYSNAFSYDAMGNRLKRENTQGTTTALTRSSVNALNQLTSVSTSVDGGPRVTSGLSYDAAGNLTEAATAGGGRTLYVYDDADRLFRIEKRDAQDAPVSKSEFIYDYASRKAVSQEFTWTAGAWVKGSEKRRVFDGLDVLQERNSDNEVTAQLVRDGNIGGILSRSTVAGASFFGYDDGGNVTLLTDENGNEVGRYRYDAFGNTLEIAGSRAGENPYRFSTKELHGASGLYDFGFRFYSAGLGRWINRDPLEEDGGLNLYAMVGNDPINDVDEYGLQKRSKFQQFFWNMGEYLDGRGRGLLRQTAEGGMGAVGAYSLRGTGGRAPARAAGARIATAGIPIFNKWNSRLPLTSLSKQIRRIHSSLPKQGSYAWLPKKCVSMRQLRTLTQHTGDEYMMFTVGSRRLVIRGSGNNVTVQGKAYDQVILANILGGKYSGHTHPPGYSLRPGPGDGPFLRSYGQEYSGIWGDAGWNVYKRPHF